MNGFTMKKNPENVLQIQKKLSYLISFGTSISMIVGITRLIVVQLPVNRRHLSNLNDVIDSENWNRTLLNSSKSIVYGCLQTIRRKRSIYTLYKFWWNDS